MYHTSEGAKGTRIALAFGPLSRITTVCSSAHYGQLVIARVPLWHGLASTTVPVLPLLLSSSCSEHVGWLYVEECSVTPRIRGKTFLPISSRLRGVDCFWGLIRGAARSFETVVVSVTC